ncbi:MAG: uncharacterized protein QOG87_667, partial [Actinomycetota bacterium]
LEGSNGVVGLTGMSYRGLNQLLVGGLLRPGTPVKAMAPASAGATTYDEPFFAGSIPSAFFYAYGGIEVVSEVPPPDQAVEQGGAELPHLAQVGADRGRTTAARNDRWQDVAAGGHLAHRDQWWTQREPIGSAEAIAQAGVPVLLTSGPEDLFGKGSLRMYAALQNAARGRSPWGPMDRTGDPDPRFQIVWSNSYTDGAFAYFLGYELQWYDHWLKGVENGVGKGNATLHLQESRGDNRWVHVPKSAYPFTDSYRSYYLAHGGALSTHAPKEQGSDVLPWASGPTLTYTSEPLTDGGTIAGPVSATIIAASTAPDVELVATLNDVAPDGTVSTALPGLEVDGAVLGTQRAVDPDRSWYGRDGEVIVPYHPYATSSAQAVPIGELVTYHIELHPRMWVVEPGHRIQLVIASQDRLLAPTQPQLARLAGGVYQVGRGGQTASALHVPLVARDTFGPAGDPAVSGLGT